VLGVTRADEADAEQLDDGLAVVLLGQERLMSAIDLNEATRELRRCLSASGRCPRQIG